jgi:hypothetical protein
MDAAQPLQNVLSPEATFNMAFVGYSSSTSDEWGSR